MRGVAGRVTVDAAFEKDRPSGDDEGNSEYDLEGPYSCRKGAV